MKNKIPNRSRPQKSVAIFEDLHIPLEKIAIDLRLSKGAVVEGLIKWLAGQPIDIQESVLNLPRSRKIVIRFDDEIESPQPIPLHSNEENPSPLKFGKRVGTRDNTRAAHSQPGKKTGDAKKP